MIPYTLSTPEGRAEVRELCEAATPGPWQSDPNNYGTYVWGPNGEMVADACHACDGVRIRGVGGKLPMEDNKAFIIAARTLLPAALEEVERLERELADANASLEMVAAFAEALNAPKEER